MIRIVKMTFQPGKVDQFRQLFDARKAKIAAFPGCHQVHLWQDLQQPEVFFTYSIWEGPEALEQYRHSPLFKDTWRHTKALFAAPAEAWSVDKVDEG